MSSHIDEANQPRMVDVGDKAATTRTAKARSRIVVGNDVMAMLENNELHSKKGPVFQTAIIAATMACKRTSEFIPFCHPLPIEDCTIDIAVDRENQAIVIDCTVKVHHKTGVEMEALTGASMAALTIYDMCKSVTHAMVIEETKLLEKYGGKSDVNLRQPNYRWPRSFYYNPFELAIVGSEPERCRQIARAIAQYRWQQLGERMAVVDRTYQREPATPHASPPELQYTTSGFHLHRHEQFDRYHNSRWLIDMDSVAIATCEIPDSIPCIFVTSATEKNTNPTICVALTEDTADTASLSAHIDRYWHAQTPTIPIHSFLPLDIRFY